MLRAHLLKSAIANRKSKIKMFACANVSA